MQLYPLVAAVTSWDSTSLVVVVFLILTSKEITQKKEKLDDTFLSWLPGGYDSSAMVVVSTRGRCSTDNSLYPCSCIHSRGHSLVVKTVVETAYSTQAGYLSQGEKSNPPYEAWILDIGMATFFFDREDFNLPVTNHHRPSQIYLSVKKYHVPFFGRVAHTFLY